MPTPEQRKIWFQSLSTPTKWCIGVCAAFVCFLPLILPFVLLERSAHQDAENRQITGVATVKLSKRSLVCTASYQSKTRELQSLINPRFDSTFKNGTLPDRITIQQVFLYAAKMNVDERVNICDGPENTINILINTCDKYLSPAFGPHRFPSVKSVEFLIKVPGWCNAAFSASPDDGIIALEFARSVMTIYSAYNYNFFGCDMNACSSDSVRNTVNIFANSGQPMGKVLYCSSIASLTNVIHPTDDEYKLALQLAAEAWADSSKPDSAALCSANLNERGLGTPENLPNALAWLQLAASVNPDNRIYVVNMQNKIAQRKAEADAASARTAFWTGATAVAVTAACMLWDSCRHLAGDVISGSAHLVGQGISAAGGVAVDIAKDAAVHSIAGIAVNAGTDAYRMYALKQAIQSVLQ